jgi:hypothetical protein
VRIEARKQKLKSEPCSARLISGHRVDSSQKLGARSAKKLKGRLSQKNILARPKINGRELAGKLECVWW